MTPLIYLNLIVTIMIKNTESASARIVGGLIANQGDLHATY